MNLVVAEVDPKRIELVGGERAQLSPIRFWTKSEYTKIPAKLGLLSAEKKQELFVYVLHPASRFEAKNYPNLSPPTNITVENNFFGASNGYFSFDINTTTASLSNVLIRNNSSPQQMYLGNALPILSNVRVVANVAPIIPSNCEGRITYSHNVWQGGICGATDLSAAAGFRNAAANDLHLVAGAAAIDRGDPSSYPATDIDGQARPQGARPDAGADEAG